MADEGIAAAAKADPDKYYLARKSGTLGTEVRYVGACAYPDSCPGYLSVKRGRACSRSCSMHQRDNACPVQEVLKEVENLVM